MLTCLLRWESLRKDALKVICFSLTSATTTADSTQDTQITHVVHLVTQTRALAILFGFWGGQPTPVKPLNQEHGTIQEHCLSLIWNILRTLLKYVEEEEGEGQDDEAERVRVKAKLSLERILFKFLE